MLWRCLGGRKNIPSLARRLGTASRPTAPLVNLISDHVAGALPEVMDAIVASNSGTRASYGKDTETEDVRRLLSEVQVHSFMMARATPLPVAARPSCDNVMGHQQQQLPP